VDAREHKVAGWGGGEFGLGGGGEQATFAPWIDLCSLRAARTAPEGENEHIMPFVHPFVPNPLVERSTATDQTAGSAELGREALDGALRDFFGRILQGEEGEEGGAGGGGGPPEPEFTGPDIGRELLTMGGLIVIGLLLCGIACVLRATGSLPRPLRKLCCATDG
jgi:hypothetical protein